MRIVRTLDAAGDAPLTECALVPTMGALHPGHLALVRRAATMGRTVVVTVFVNPTQFAPGEDYERYPRRLDEDAAAAARAGADVVFAPEPALVYPPDDEVAVPPLPAVATEPGLEDAHRPGHFEGVAQVVARFFDLVRPGAALFGEKDYQQLLVIRAMVDADRARFGDLEIVGVPTVRDPDGLAMSSRNEYLDDDARACALGLSRALQIAHAAQHPETAERMMHDTLAAHDLEVEYAVVRDAETLQPVETLERPTRALIAARADAVRLIDNAALPVWR